MTGWGAGPETGSDSQQPDLGRVLAELREFVDLAEQESEQDTPAPDESDDERAKAARAGHLGPDWQRVQQRIDLGVTTLEDVFSGRDDTPAARALLANATRNLGALHDRWAAQAAGGEDTPLAEMARIEQEHTQRVDHLRRVVERWNRA